MTIEEIQYEAQGIMQEWGSNDSAPYVDEDGIYLDSDSLGVCLMAWPPSKLHCKEGDTLIIQMRKRKSSDEQDRFITLPALH